MAIITTTLNRNAEVVPFTGLSQRGLDRSAVPRADVVYNGLNLAVPAPGAGNSSNLVIRCDLPNNFAYSIAEAHILLFSSTGNTWAALGSLAINNADPTTSQISMEVLSNGVSDAAGFSRQVWMPIGLSNTLIRSAPDASGPNIQFILDNPNLNHVAATCSFFVRVYQYDIEQAHHYAVNTPTLIR